MKRRHLPLLLALSAGPCAEPHAVAGPPVPEPPAEAPLGVRPEPSGPLWVEVEARSKEERTAAHAAGLAIEEVRGDRTGGTADASSLAALRAAGLAILRTERLGGLRPEDFPAADARYHNYEEAASVLRGLAQARPELASLFSLGRSHEGRELWALKLTKGPGVKPAAAFLGTHHAREHLATEVPLLLARRLVERADDPEVSRLLETREVYIAPMVNPDGVEHDLRDDRYHWHRKNMRRNRDGSLGVDLNRNYATGWGGPGSSGSTRSDTYRGPEPFSEPESRAVRAFLMERRNIRTLVSFHTFSELILYPFGHKDDPVPDAADRSAFEAMARRMAQWNGYTPQQSSELYLAGGDTCDWAYEQLGMFAFTFELTPKSMGGGGFYPGAGVVDSTFEANWRPALYLIDLADDPRRAGAPALETGLPPAAPEAL